MDLPVQGLFQQLHAREVSGEHLEVLGKQASDRWAEGVYKTLTEAVVETVKHAGLAPEQVRRVIEFTNTNAFQREFKKEGAHRVVNFQGGPADPAEVLRDLNDGGGGTVFDSGLGDYDQPPAEKHGEVADDALMALFQRDPEVLPYEDPLSAIVDARDKLAAAHDHIVAQMGGLELMFGDLCERLFDTVKQASLEGMPLGHIAQALDAVSPSESHTKIAFRFFGPRLLREGVFSSLEQMSASVEKTAGARRINPTHPLLVDFGEFCEVLDKLSHLRGALDVVDSELGQANVFLKQAAGGVIPAAAKALQRGGDAAGKAVGPLAEKLYAGSGERAADLASKAVRYGVPLVAGNEVRRHLKYSPGFQAAKDTALSVVPMTPQYQQREWEIASGQ